MYYLLEAPVGLALFQKTDSVSLVAKMVYKSIAAALETMKSLNGEGEIPEDVRQFLAANLPQACELNVLNPELAAAVGRLFAVKTLCRMDDDFRRLRTNSFKHFEMNRDIYNALTLRISHQLADASPDDVLLVETLSTIEELEKGINGRFMRLKEWYSLHFPELAQITDTAEYLRLLMVIGNRKAYLAAAAEPSDAAPESAVPESISAMVSNSMGVDIKDHDISKIKADAANILSDLEYKKTLSAYLKSKCQSAFPNLYHVAGESVTAKLIKKYGTLSRLASSPASSIQIAGAEKSFEQAVKEKGNTPKYGIIFDIKAVSKAAPQNGGKMARMCANKISLCARVDLSGECLDGAFGQKAKAAIDSQYKTLEDRGKPSKKPVKQHKKKVISVKEYDQLRDSTKRVKNN
ncbi:nucleolar protein 56 [Pancytospora philotis]|nr:nucleolar protein 56 [Pancytospora philotis]